jgi:hypothetical protein
MHMFSHVTAWGYFWLAWMLTALGVELYWLFVNAANTLSRQIWGVEMLDLSHPLDFSDWTWLHILITVVLWGFFAWLSVHFPFGYIR